MEISGSGEENRLDLDIRFLTELRFIMTVFLLNSVKFSSCLMCDQNWQIKSRHNQRKFRSVKNMHDTIKIRIRFGKSGMKIHFSIYFLIESQAKYKKEQTHFEIEKKVHFEWSRKNFPI